MKYEMVRYDDGHDTVDSISLRECVSTSPLLDHTHRGIESIRRRIPRPKGAGKKKF